jgi:ADP-ribosylation factor-binding protein GGA
MKCFHEITEKLLTLNDMINNVTAKFADIRKGIFDTHYEVNGTQPQQTNSAEPPKQAISLIDFDDEVPQSTNGTPSTQPNQSKASSGNLMDELDGLFGPSTKISTPGSSTSASADLFDLTAPMGSMSLDTSSRIPQQHLAPISPGARSIPIASPSPTSLPDSTFGSPMTSAANINTGSPVTLGQVPNTSTETRKLLPLIRHLIVVRVLNHLRYRSSNYIFGEEWT